MSQSFILVFKDQNHKTSVSLDELKSWYQNLKSLSLITDVIFLSPDEERPSLGIDLIRQLISKLSFGSSVNSPRLVIINQAHLLTLEAQNALLKTLEEPPNYTDILLTTGQPNRLLPTIHSRCQTIFWPENTSIKQSNQQDIKVSSYTQAIKLAEEYKDKTRALNYLAKLAQQENLSPVKRQQVLTAIERINANHNVRLTLENLLFQFVPQTN